MNATKAAWDEITRVADILRSIPEASVLLLGSAARGELAEGWIGGRREVFSDYEFMVVTAHRVDSRTRAEIQRRVDTLRRSLGYRNPLFHIDVTWQQRDRLPRLPPTIFTFELKENARLLAGPDIRPHIPIVTLANLNRYKTNDILHNRLWAVLLYIPSAFIRGRMSELEEITTGYLLARNALDLSTVLLPMQGILLPTYRQRIAYWQEYGLADAVTAMGPGFVPFLARCLVERQRLRFSQCAWARYPKLIAYLTKGLHIIGYDQDDPISRPSPFAEWPIGRGEWLQLARLIIRVVRSKGITFAWEWLRLPRKALRVAGLLAMHRALVAWQAGDETSAQKELARSQQVLARIALTPTQIDGGPFVERWLELRRRWADYWLEHVRLGDPRYHQRFNRILEWRCD